MKQKLDDIHSAYDKGKKNSTSDLYIGYYFIDGYISKGKYLRGPIFTIPCEIGKIKSTNQKDLEYSINPLCNEPILNTMLFMEICKYNNIELDDNFINNLKITKEDDEIDIIQQVFDIIGSKFYMDNEDTRYVKFKNYSKDNQSPKLEEFEGENRFRLKKVWFLEYSLKIRLLYIIIT